MPTLNGPDAPNAVNQTTALKTDPGHAHGRDLRPRFDSPSTVTVDPRQYRRGLSDRPGDESRRSSVRGHGPITISGTSEITGFGNATWITVDDVTDPVTPVFVTGFNPANPIPTPSASNSTDSFGNFKFTWDPSTLYGTNYGVKTIEVFATDNAGSVGNKVLYSFNWDPATALIFAKSGEPPAVAQPNTDFASSPNVVVDALDFFGKIATTYNGPVTIGLVGSLPGLSGTLTVDAVAGVATFTNLQIGPDGTYMLAATSPGLTSDDSTSITIVGPAYSLYVQPEPPSSVVAGVPFGFTVGADDIQGNPTPFFTGNVSVAMMANPGGSNPSGVAQTVVVSGGFANFSGLSLNKVGQGYTLKVTSGSLVSAITTGINVTNAPADHLLIAQANEPPSTVIAGNTFSLTVTAFDPFGNVDTGFSGQIGLALANGEVGTLTGAAPVTVNNGMASFSSIAIDTTGTFQLVATSSPALTSTTSTSILVTPAAPTQLVWDTQPQPPIVHNIPFGVSLDLEDTYGNLETSLLATASIVLDKNPGNATLGGTIPVDLANGVAAFPDLSISAVGSGYALKATSDGISSVDSNLITVLPTPAASLAVSMQPPTSSMVHQTFSFAVTALDQLGNPDPDFTGSITIALAPGAATDQLNGTLTETAVAGVATFNDLSVWTVGNGYSLVATSTGLPSVTSDSFNVVPAAAYKLLVTTSPPGTVAAGSQFSMVVTAEDMYGNLATSFTGNESVTIVPMTGPSGAALTGTVGATANDGVATISGMTLTTATTFSTPYKLQIASPSLNSPNWCRTLNLPRRSTSRLWPLRNSCSRPSRRRV